MADMYITVGVDTTNKSYEEFEKGLKELISKIDPPKIPIKLEIDNTAVENLRKQLTELNKLWSSSGGSSSRKKTANTLEIGTKEYSNSLKTANDLLITMENNARKWSAAESGRSKKHYLAYQELINSLRNLISDIEKGGYATDKFNQRLSGIKSESAMAARGIKEAGEATQTWTQRVGKLSEKFTTWLSMTRIIMAIVNAMKRMVSSVVDIDTAMTELKKVTNESDETYNRFLKNASSRAKKLGASISDIVSASADFARLGYDIGDAEKLADVAVLYKNVGDGVADINAASESIISTLQGFQLTADQAESIVDKFNIVGNNFAISSGGIGEALSRSAAAMYAANNTLDETIALVAAANTIVQNPDSVGTTLKTVSMYLRAAKTEAEDAGESTDGMLGSVSELRGEILKLTGNKVDIQLNDNEFKSTYQILKELSQVWDDISDVSQANILEMIGGKRNANVVAALLENFSIAEEALGTAVDSAGSAAAENEKYLKSIAGKIQLFKAAFEELSQTIVDSELIKFFVDLGTVGVEALDKVAKLIDAINTFGGNLSGIGGTIGALSGLALHKAGFGECTYSSGVCTAPTPPRLYNNAI